MSHANAAKILIVDDEAQNIEVLRRLMTRLGYAVLTASNGESGLESVARDAPDLVLLDVRMPGIDGFEVCRRLKADPATRLIPVVLITTLTDSKDRVSGINAGADDFVAKPPVFAELEARVRSLTRLKRYTDELDSAESVILSLALTVEAREPYTSGHCHRMAAYGAAFGMHLGLSNEDVAALHRGGYLHDLGKIAVPDAILSKPGPLTRDEFEVMKTHTVVGESLCGQLRVLRPVRPIVRSHHERLDGSGYPDGLRGNEVPLLAQIMGIVDIYDALTTDRQYRAALSDEIACAELTGDAERGWRSRALVDEFIAICRTGRLKEMAGPIGLQRTLERMALSRTH